MKKTLWGVAFVAVALASASSLSAAKYGMAGCGLGSTIFTENKMVPQILAGTTNNIYGTQSFAITMGTSNCTEDAKSFNEKEQHTFVLVNLFSLEHEMAAGGGERLNALSGLMGCPADLRSEFRLVSRESFREATATGKSVTAPELLKRLRENMSKNKALAGGCRV